MGLPKLITVEEFFAPPVRASASISPDGTMIAYLAPRKNRLNVWVQGIGSTEARCVTHDETRSVTGFFWGDDPAGCSTCKTPAATRTGTCTAWT